MSSFSLFPGLCASFDRAPSVHRMEKANTRCYRGLIDESGLTIPKLTRRSADDGTILIEAAA